MDPRPEPETRFFETARLKSMLRKMGWLSLGVGLLAAAFMGLTDPDPSIHVILATFILAGGSMLVGTFLMTLIYFSARSGIDAEAADHDESPSQ